MTDSNKIVDYSKTLPEYHITGNVYDYDHLQDFLTDPYVIEGFFLEDQKSKKLSYINAPAAFDIETSSFYAKTGKKPEKVAIMYIWQFGINGSVIYGRTWSQFIHLIQEVVNYYHLTTNRRLVVFVHNLAYEFQFLQRLVNWDKVFALKNRTPVYAITGGIEFRCSYKLSNYSLDYLGTHILTKYKVEKKTGDLDYTKIRHSTTPLTQEELDYCIYDVYVVMAYIRERIEADGGISQIPLTNTGYVRNHCRALTLSSPRYRAIMRGLTINSSEYASLKRAFMGGFTHANIMHVNSRLFNIASYDIASDYPARTVLDYFPMGKSIHYNKIVDYEQMKKLLEHYCVVFDLALHNLSPKVEFENIISVSRVKFLEGQRDYISNNGRLVSCDGWIRTTVTEIDFQWICKFYDFDKAEFTNIYAYPRGYLPTEFVNAVLDFYEAKTTLKGVEGKEVEYMVGKNRLNSTYGMMVTDIVREENAFESGGWVKGYPELDNAVGHYNKSYNRFLFYPWGVYVTAHARSQLFEIMYKIGGDYVYSDTDSLKILNHKDYDYIFDEYNNKILCKIIAAAKFHNIPLNRFMPTDIKGKKHPIGFFEYEGEYKSFKTCGAKRYIYTDESDELHITVAGLGKTAGLKYLKETFGTNDAIFAVFTDGLSIPAGKTGKLTHTYIDEARMGVVVDYLGNKNFYYEKSATHLEPASFHMSMLDSYLNYIYGLEELIYFE